MKVYSGTKTLLDVNISMKNERSECFVLSKLKYLKRINDRKNHVNFHTCTAFINDLYRNTFPYIIIHYYPCSTDQKQ